MAVFVLNLPVLAMDEELGALVLANLASGIDGILLFVEMTSTTRRAVILDVPSFDVTGRWMPLYPPELQLVTQFRVVLCGFLWVQKPTKFCP